MLSVVVIKKIRIMRSLYNTSLRKFFIAPGVSGAKNAPSFTGCLTIQF